ANRDGAVTFGQALTVRSQNQRNVGEGRRSGAQRPVQQNLPGGRFEQVFPADDLLDGHLDVVRDDGEMVGVQPVGPANDEVTMLGGVVADGAPSSIDESNLALRDPEAEGGWPPLSQPFAHLLSR